MKNTQKKLTSIFLVLTLLIVTLLSNNNSTLAASSSSSAIFRLLNSNAVRPSNGSYSSSSNYTTLGLGKVTGKKAYGDVSSSIVSLPDISNIEIKDYQTLEWYSVSKDFLFWKVDGQIVDKPEGTIINAEYRIINDGAKQSTNGSFSKDYTSIGMGKIKLKSVYGSDAYKQIVSTPDISSITSSGDKIYWYNIGKNDGNWIVEGVIIKVTKPNTTALNQTVTESTTDANAWDNNNTTTFEPVIVEKTLDNSDNLPTQDYIDEDTSSNDAVAWDNTSDDTTDNTTEDTNNTSNEDCFVEDVPTFSSPSIDVPPIDIENCIEAEEIVNIKNEGAIGNGIVDDSDVINKVLNSGVKKVYFPAGSYKCAKRIEINNVDGLSIYGDGADSIIMTDNDYNKDGSSNTESFFTLWECKNISFEKICIKACEEWTVRYSRQIGAYYVENISFENCSFIVPATVKKQGPNTDREYSNLIFFTGWKNITVNNCYFEQLGGVERGSNIILTDIWNAGCEYATITNNKFYHNAHDEMFSLFGGKEESSSMKHITVTNNEFNALYSKDVTSRTMCFTFAYTDSKNVSDVIFKDNTINAVTPGSLMTFGVIDGCDVSNNTINVTNNSDYNNGIVFSGTPSVNVHNNDITVNGTKEKGMAIIACGNMLFENNTLTINTSMRYVFAEATIKNNNITLNGATESIAQAPRLMTGNTVTMNSRVDNFISYIQIKLGYESVTTNNIFNYNFDDTADAVSFLTGNAVYANIGTYLCDNKVIFSHNTISAENANPFRKNLLSYCVLDSSSQTFEIIGNISNVYKDSVYLCQGTTANIITE